MPEPVEPILKLKVQIDKLKEKLAEAEASLGKSNKGSFSAIIPDWAAQAMSIDLLVSLDPGAAQVIRMLAKAEEWLIKLSALTQQKPEELSIFLANTYAVSIPACKVSSLLLDQGRMIEQADKFIWITEKLYRYYLSEGELPKKGEPLVIAWKEYAPVDWAKLVDELRGATNPS